MSWTSLPHVSTGELATAAVQNQLLDDLTDLRAGNLDGPLTVTGVGNHAFTGGASGANSAHAMTISNVNVGASATADLRMDNDVRTINLTLRSYSNGAGSTVPDVGDSVLLRANGAGGLTLSAQHVDGVIRFVLVTTQRAQIDATGNWILGSGTNITDGISAPTIASGFGTSPTIVGKSYGFRITIGSGASTGGVVNFGTTFSNPPICIGALDQSGNPPLLGAPSTTQISIGYLTGAAGQHIDVLVRGY